MDTESDINSDTNDSITSTIFYNIFNDLTENEFNDVIDTIEYLFLTYIDEYFINMKEHKFIDNCINTIANELYIYWLDYNICTINNFDEIYSIVSSQINVLLIKHSILPYVSEHNLDRLNNIDNINDIIKYVNSIPQPEQKSTEWYKFRNNLISASSMWKVFKSNTTKNNLINEKTKPKNYNNIFAASMEWGNKYEPISILIYEYMFNTKIGEYGCLTHKDYPFIGASPDGINIKQNSPLYGRMLEIKNIVNRDITGIPKEDYWIQTQIQMETFNLNYCDFLETRFIEYTEFEFYNDTISEYKGIILHFTKNFNNDTETSIYDINSIKPIYEYYPINKCIEYQDIQSWINDTRNKYNDDYILYTTLYWKLDEFSCVLIERNKKWFNNALPYIKDTYDQIIHNRKKNNLIINIDNNDNHIIHNMPPNNKHINVIKK